MADIVQSVVGSFLAPEERARLAEERARLAEERARLAEERARLAEERARNSETVMGQMLSVSVCSLNTCANRVRGVMASWDGEPSRREGPACRRMMDSIVHELRRAIEVVINGPVGDEAALAGEEDEDSALEEIRREHNASIAGLM